MAEEIVGLRATTEGALKFVLCVETDPENSPHIGSWSREGHAAAITSPVFWHLLILQDDLSQGYLIARDLCAEGKGVFLKRIAVLSKVGGLGRQAISQFIQSLSPLGPSRIWLAVDVENARAQRTYRALGFEEMAGLEVAVDGFPDHSFLMVKHLERLS
jgi:hypothetical protein